MFSCPCVDLVGTYCFLCLLVSVLLEVVLGLELVLAGGTLTGSQHYWKRSHASLVLNKWPMTSNRDFLGASFIWPRDHFLSQDVFQYLMLSQ